MSVLFLLIPLSLLLAAGFLGAFFWAVRSGQYDDTGTPSMRLLTEERLARPTDLTRSMEADRPPIFEKPAPGSHATNSPVVTNQIRS